MPKIPSLPISYGEAEKILRRLGGPRVPDEWQGGLPFSYHVGPGAAAVAMDVQMDEGLKPIYNVVARIKGSVEPEKLVVLGNHRDAWTHGAVDPNSGTAAMLEMARGSGGGAEERVDAEADDPASRAGTPRSTASSDRPSGRRSTRRICRTTPSRISTAMSR